MTRDSCFVTLVGLGCCLSFGCGAEGGSQTSVKGRVSLDGQPIDQGAIHFMATASKGKNFSGAIANGEYALPAKESPTPGTYRVELHWTKKTGKKVRDGAISVDETAEGMPAKFNKESNLSAEIKAGENLLNYDVNSQ